MFSPDRHVQLRCRSAFLRMLGDDKLITSEAGGWVHILSLERTIKERLNTPR